MTRTILALVFCAACASGHDDPPTCTDGIANGDETDVDCGGTCGVCADGLGCASGTDCESKVCNGVCAAPTCSDGVQNGAEGALDCGGTCPPTYSGVGCVTGTNGTMVCTSYTGGAMFTVTITWSAAGGNAYVDYVTAHGATGEDFNSDGIVGGGPVNICTTGPMSVTFELPLGAGYMYKVWHAYCVRTDACSGCGNDTTTATGGPFGVYPNC